MKKLSLFATCVMPIALVACYSTSESVDERTMARRDFQKINGCQEQAVYQHEYFKNCVEKTAANKKAKTVSYMEDNKGNTIVVPKTDDDAQMKNPNMVYPVVDTTTSGSVDIEEGSATVPEAVAPKPVPAPAPAPVAAPAPVVVSQTVPVTQKPLSQEGQSLADKVNALLGQGGASVTTSEPVPAPAPAAVQKEVLPLEEK